MDPGYFMHPAKLSPERASSCFQLYFRASYSLFQIHPKLASPFNLIGNTMHTRFI